MTGLFTLDNLIIFVLCYFIGSFPTAYLIVKARSNKDLTREGSGNVGTLNSFQVSKSKAIGITVLLTDVLKGALPLYIMLYVLNLGYAPAMIGACSLLLGHNYPVWLKFKGGRGLATGAGIFIIINYFILIGWLAVWFIVFAFKKKVLIANTIATFSLPVYVLLINVVPFMVINNNTSGFSLFYFNVFSLIITAIILSRHTEVFKPKSEK
ncbi:MAG: glycerol-3-phosphate acyltransferase [Ignavibacteria bacterium]